MQYEFNPRRLSQLRREFSLSRGGIGARVGTTSSQVKKWEYLGTDPSLRTIAKLCNAFDKEPNWFFTRGDIPKAFKPEQELVDA